MTALQIQEYLNASEDPYTPLVDNESLQGWDNYCIYTLVCLHYRYENTSFGIAIPPFLFPNPNGSYQKINVNDQTLIRTIQAPMQSFLAYQQFCVAKPLVNFGDVIDLLPLVLPRSLYLHRIVEIVEVNQESNLSYEPTPGELQGIAIQVEEARVANELLGANQFTFVLLIPSEFLGYPNLYSGPRYSRGSSQIKRYNYSIIGQEIEIPTYLSLVGGYSLDPRLIPASFAPMVIPTIDGDVIVSYYRANPYEPILNLTSIDCVYLRLKAVKDKPLIINLEGIVFGTLEITGSDVKEQLISLPALLNSYRWADYLFDNVTSIFGQWVSIYQGYNFPANPGRNPDIFAKDYKVYDSPPIFRRLGATNNFANNDPGSYENINFDAEHPLFKVDNDRAYRWHVEENSQGRGSLIMDSPLLRKIGYALDAEKYSIDEATGLPRLANLGHLIARISSLLGYRPNPDGTFTKAEEQKIMRTIVDSTTSIDPVKTGVNNFGSESMVIRRLNNRFDGDKVVADECVVIYDLLQLLAEYQDQLNLALNLQESSAIEIKEKDKSARYPNQLSLAIELLNLANSNHDTIRAALVSSLIAQAQTSEIIAALGLPSVTKTLPIQIGNEIEQLPYQGVSPHRSISQEIAICTQNVGIVLGQVI